MYDIMVFWDYVTDQIFLIYCYLNGTHETENLPDRFKALVGLQLDEWLDDYLLQNGCVHLGHL